MLKLEGRRWGHFKVLHKGTDYVVKELVIHPGRGISYQRHFNREEYWWIRQGTATIKYSHDDSEWNRYAVRESGRSFRVHKEMWHMVFNESNEDLHILELQVGECSEEDIERLYYYEEVEQNEKSRGSKGSGRGSLKAGSGLVS
jgi:mannose-6-phosphate isomerase-like protein (cupin superfamily)